MKPEQQIPAHPLWRIRLPLLLQTLVWLVPGLSCFTWGCASNPHVRVRRLENGLLQVDGPLAGPFSKPEDLAESACELMTREPGASNGLHGSEYCALHYYSPEHDAFYLSYLSDIKPSLATETKSCELPRTLNDPARKDALILGGVHTHPHNRKFSRRDLSVAARWAPTRFVEKRTGKVFDRSLWMFFRERTGECRADLYNHFTHTVSALRNGEMVPIGKVGNDAGDIQMLAGKDWLP
jgi:hypothetical protein